MALPSAVEDATLVDVGLDRNGRVIENGKGSRRLSLVRRFDEAVEGGGGGRG